MTNKRAEHQFAPNRIVYSKFQSQCLSPAEQIHGLTALQKRQSSPIDLAVHKYPIISLEFRI